MEKLGFQSLGASFDCACGKTHRVPIEVCHVGVDAAERLGELARERCGDSCLIISDENTRDVGGEQVLSALTSAGKEVTEKVFGRDPIVVTDVLGEEVAAGGAGFSFFVAVGSGSLSDLAKYAGNKHGRPVLLYPTAASMNGYTSDIVAMDVRGLKSTVPCVPAVGVFADPEVVATAPPQMAAAGVADFLSKCSAYPDWFAAHFFRGDHFCERAREFYDEIQEKVLAAAPAIGRGEPEAIALCIEALLLSGLSMVVAGSSAPSSGGEHLVSHYLDMKHLLNGSPVDLHGTQVGVGTVHCLGLWEKVLALDPDGLDLDALVDAQPSSNQVQGWIEDDWGEVAGEVLGQWRQKELDRAGLRLELERFQKGFFELREAVGRYLLPSATVAGAIHVAGGPITGEKFQASTEQYYRALRFARFLRNRFTILDLAAQLCVE